MDDAQGVARRISLLNQKGGVGKTTTSVNLAAGLARLGRRTLLIDLDPQAHATLHLGVEPDQAEHTVYDLLLDEDADPRACATNVSEGLDLIASETDLAAAEHELASLPNRQSRLRSALKRVEREYDAILIDCPPSLGLLTVNALAATDEVLIPMQAHFLALQGVGKLLETVRLVGASVNPDLRVAGVVLCMFDSQTTHTQEVVADIESFFESARGQNVPWSGAKLYQPAIRRNIKLAECPSFGQTIFDYAPSAAGAQDYGALAQAFAADQPVARTPTAPVSEPKADDAPADEPVVMTVPQELRERAV